MREGTAAWATAAVRVGSKPTTLLQPRLLLPSEWDQNQLHFSSLIFLSYNMRCAQGNLVNSNNASEPMQTVNTANKYMVLGWQYLLSKDKS